MANATILIADDEPAVTTPLEAVLSADGYNVVVVSDGNAALERLEQDDIALVLTDLKMPGLDGMALLEAVRTRELLVECIIITGEASVDSAVEAMRVGRLRLHREAAHRQKLTRLKALIPKAIEKEATRRKNRELSSRLEGLTSFGELIGQSEPMREVYGLIEAVAPTNASVLILGESGTGKELVARAVHQKSDRAKGPFYALNCAALPKEILENELFGHEKGAFTGSVNEKTGAFENASGGTLFLDELAEMPPDIQVKLLRALETRSIRRLGGKKEIPVDIRIVAATNKDIQKAIADERAARGPLLPARGGGDSSCRRCASAVPTSSSSPRRSCSGIAKQNGKQLTGFDDGAREWMTMLPLAGQRARAEERDRARRDPRPDHRGERSRPAAAAPPRLRGEPRPGDAVLRVVGGRCAPPAGAAHVCPARWRPAQGRRDAGPERNATSRRADGHAGPARSVRRCPAGG